MGRNLIFFDRQFKGILLHQRRQYPALQFVKLSFEEGRECPFVTVALFGVWVVFLKLFQGLVEQAGGQFLVFRQRFQLQAAFDIQSSLGRNDGLCLPQELGQPHFVADFGAGFFGGIVVFHSCLCPRASRVRPGGCCFYFSILAAGVARPGREGDSVTHRGELLSNGGKL